MKIIEQKKDSVTVQTQTLDDVWVLYKLIGVEDRISGKTFRKVTIGDAAVDRNVKQVKKPVFLTIQTEKTEYEPEHALLRVTGIIVDGPDDVSRGEYHSFAIDEKTQISISKEWKQYELDKLHQATELIAPTLIVLFDREQALFAKLTKKGHEMLTTLSGSVAKKADVKVEQSDFYGEICKLVNSYNEKLSPGVIVLSSAPFWKNYVLEKLQGTPAAKKVQYIESHAVHEQTITSLLKTPQFANMKSSDAQIVALFEDFLKRVSQDNLATYGFDHCVQAAQAGAVEHLLVSNQIMQQFKEEEKFEQIEELLKLVEQSKGKVHIVDESPITKNLNSLGGFAAILRFEA